MHLVSIPANPVPEGAVTGTLRAPDGVALRFARWPAPPGRKGTVCLFHGRAEFIEKYFESVRELQARGFAVATLDWRGQGLSDRALADTHKGHVYDFDEYNVSTGKKIASKSAYPLGEMGCYFGDEVSNLASIGNAARNLPADALRLVTVKLK